MILSDVLLLILPSGFRFFPLSFRKKILQEVGGVNRSFWGPGTGSF